MDKDPLPASKVKSSIPFSSSLTYTIAERKERTTETDKERKKQTPCHHHLWEIWILMTRKTYRVVASTRNQSLLRKDLPSFLTCWATLPATSRSAMTHKWHILYSEQSLNLSPMNGCRKLWVCAIATFINFFNLPLRIQVTFAHTTSCKWIR